MVAGLQGGRVAGLQGCRVARWQGCKVAGLQGGRVAGWQGGRLHRFKQDVQNMRYYERGVTIAMGTDAGVMPHGTNLRELGLMCNIGMSPMESIVATTKVAAKCLGWDDRLGTVERGKLADLIIVAVDPLKEIRSLERQENIKVVIQSGKVLKDIR